jgi:hypothetical protein
VIKSKIFFICILLGKNYLSNRIPLHVVKHKFCKMGVDGVLLWLSAVKYDVGDLYGPAPSYRGNIASLWDAAVLLYISTDILSLMGQRIFGR